MSAYDRWRTAEPPEDESPEPEIEDGDYTTSDHRVFVQHGKVVLELDRDLDEADMWIALESHMAAARVWPNVWFISDHGNEHLMTRPR